MQLPCGFTRFAKITASQPPTICKFIKTDYSCQLTNSFMRISHLAGVSLRFTPARCRKLLEEIPYGYNVIKKNSHSYHFLGSPYKTVQVNNFNKLHIIASGGTWRKIRCLQSKSGRYFQTCIAL